MTTLTIAQAWDNLQARETSFACHHCNLCQLPFSRSMCQSLVRLQTLWSSPWFKRIWIIQEAASGPLVFFLYGKHGSGYESLKNAAELNVRFTHLPVGLMPGSVDFGPAQRAHSTLSHISRLRHLQPSPSVGEDGIYNESLASINLSSVRVSTTSLQQVSGRLLHNLIWCADLLATLPTISSTPYGLLRKF